MRGGVGGTGGTRNSSSANSCSPVCSRDSSPITGPDNAGGSSLDVGRDGLIGEASLDAGCELERLGEVSFRALDWLFQFVWVALATEDKEEAELISEYRSQGQGAALAPVLSVGSLGQPSWLGSECTCSSLMDENASID